MNTVDKFREEVRKDLAEIEDIISKVKDSTFFGRDIIFGTKLRVLKESYIASRRNLKLKREE